MVNANIALTLLLIVCLFVMGFLLIELSTFEPKVTCKTLSSIQEVRAELPAHPELDKNHDGKPCEMEFPNQ